MKLKKWIKLQTISVFKTLSISLFLIIMPIAVTILFWQQSAHVASIVDANEKTLLNAIQTGDLFMLEKIASNIQADKSVLNFEINDQNGIAIRSYKSVMNPFFSFELSKNISGVDGTFWGVVHVIWTPRLESLYYFVATALIIVLFAAVLNYIKWKEFSDTFLISMEQIQNYFHLSQAPQLNSQIDEFHELFLALQKLRLNEIEKANLQLRIEKERSLIELSQRVAHDIRTPLSSLSLLVPSAVQNGEVKDVINDSIKRIHEICSDLLSQRRKSSVDLKDNLDITLKQILSSSQLIFPNKYIVFEIAPELKTKSIPCVEFKSVLNNLVTNALEAVKPISGIVKIVVTEELKTMKFQIHDNGCGIPDDIIQMLGCAQVSFGKGSLGNGLGFFNAKKWATTVGGTLYVNSQLNVGSSVFLEIPKRHFS